MCKHCHAYSMMARNKKMLTTAKACSTLKAHNNRRHSMSNDGLIPEDGYETDAAGTFTGVQK